MNNVDDKNIKYPFSNLLFMVSSDKINRNII